MICKCSESYDLRTPYFAGTTIESYDLQAQFVAIVSHTGYNMFIRTDCDYPWLYNAITFYYTWSMLFLFLHFYYTSYVLPKRRRRPQQKVETTEAATVEEGSPSETKSPPYINGYVTGSPAAYLRSRAKNGNINGNASHIG